MIFDLIQMTDEQKDILDIARQICEKELVPQIPELDRTGTYPKDVAQKLTDAGLYAMEQKLWDIMTLDLALLFMLAAWVPSVSLWAELKIRSSSRPTNC